MSDKLFDGASDGIRKMREEAEKMLAIQKRIESGIGEYAKALKDIHKTEQDILYVQKQIKAQETKLKDVQALHAAEIASLEAKKRKTKKDKERLHLLNEEIKLEAIKLGIQQKELKNIEEQLEILKKSTKEANKLKSIGRSSVNFLKTWGFDKLQAYGVFEMDKEIRNAARSMGVGNKEFSKFSENLERAGKVTGSMGVGTKQLAVLQRSYSEEIGRSVQLSQKGLEALGSMAESTGLGQEFAASFAASMDTFGGSVETSAELMKETLNNADRIGVSSAKAAKVLQQNLKLAQKYGFKNGITGLAKMSTEAVKLKLDMEGIAGLADKVFRPEGAVEMAAKLQTMGGSFAQLGNPFELMFKARNDFEAFSKDIGKASAEFLTFNKETGTFDVKGGLARDRMRELGNMLGIGVDKLQEMAEAQKRIEMIGSVLPVGVDKDTIELITGISEIGKNGEIKITKGDFDGQFLKDLTVTQLNTIKAEQKTLKERAERSRTAMEDFMDIKQSLQELLIPVAQELKESVAKPLKELMYGKNGKEFMMSIREFVKTAASLIGKISKFVIENPITSLVTALTGWVALKVATWYANGLALGSGFLTMTRGMFGGVPGGVPGAGPSSSIKGPAGGFFGKIGGGASFGKNFSTAARSIGARSAGAIAGLTTGIMEYNENEERGMEKSENLQRSITKGGLAGLGAFGATALVAAALAPFTGGLSLLAAGAIGGMAGAYAGSSLGEGINTARFGGKMNSAGNETVTDYSEANDAIVKFNPKDKFMKMNDGAILASTQEGQLHKAAKELSGGNGELKHKFEELKINIRITAEGISDEVAKKLVDSKTFVRQLNTKIRQEAAMAVSGGILNPSPK